MGGLAKIAVICAAVFLFSGTVYSAEEASVGSTHGPVNTLLWIAVLVLAAKFSSLVERFGQSAVLGELTIGVVLGNLALIGIEWFEPIKTDEFIPFLAEVGVIILLFQVGLESNIAQMKKVGSRASMVAAVGVIVPFVLGTYVVGPMLLPGLNHNAYLFLGAALTATSVGITARVFKDLSRLKTPEAQIVLGAAVIDDVLGLVILAVVTAIATVGSVTIGSIAFITGKALAFLVGSIFLGCLLAPSLGRLMSKIHTGIGMKFALALTFAFGFAFAAGHIGLAPIIGAFAAGLVLEPVHFRYFCNPVFTGEIEQYSEKLPDSQRKELLEITHRHNHRHVEDLIEPLGHFLVPIFFVFTGIGVNLTTLANPRVLLVGLGFSVLAFLSKLVAGLAAGKVNKAVVGIGMVPRGEVGLIFATVGKSLGVISDELFSVIIIMVILTTLLTPPILTHLLKAQRMPLKLKAA